MNGKGENEGKEERWMRDEIDENRSEEKLKQNGKERERERQNGRETNREKREIDGQTN